MTVNPMRNTRIETERLVLRPLQASDADTIFELRSHREVYKWS